MHVWWQIRRDKVAEFWMSTGAYFVTALNDFHPGDVSSTYQERLSIDPVLAQPSTFPWRRQHNTQQKNTILNRIVAVWHLQWAEVWICIRLVTHHWTPFMPLLQCTRDAKYVSLTVLTGLHFEQFMCSMCWSMFSMSATRTESALTNCNPTRTFVMPTHKNIYIYLFCAAGTCLIGKCARGGQACCGNGMRHQQPVAACTCTFNQTHTHPGLLGFVT